MTQQRGLPSPLAGEGSGVRGRRKTEPDDEGSQDRSNEEDVAMTPPRISKLAFERALPALRDELLNLQQKLHTSKSCAIAVILAGTPAAGRSETVNELLEWLDPKHIGVHALGAPSAEDRKFPPMWRYWQKLPARGRMTFFFAGWYSEYLGGVIKDSQAKHRDKRSVERILQLEKMLVRDGVRVVKIYL